MRERIAWSAVLALTLACGQRRERVASVAASIMPPAHTRFVLRDGGGAPAVSPDGTKIVFAAADANAPRDARNARLWVRALDGESSAIAGTEGASDPFWSPDGKSIAFFADGQLKTVALNAAPVVRCAAPNARGGAWRGDSILFGTRAGAIHRTSPIGAVAVAITELGGGETAHGWPLLLPDERNFLYLANGVVWVAPLDRPGDRKLLLRTPASVGLAGETLLFVRDDELFTQKLDLEKLELAGKPRRVAAHIGVDRLSGRALFGASESTLILQGGVSLSNMRLSVVTRDGTILATLPAPGSVLSPALSPDGRSIAVAIPETATGEQRIWIADRERGSTTRLSSGTRELSPAWSPDSQWIAYSSAVERERKIMRKRADGSSEEELLSMRAAALAPSSWSPDGTSIAVTMRPSAPRAETEIWLCDVGARTAAKLLDAPDASYSFAQFSPDGKWLAYVSDESGVSEVWVTRMPGAQGRWQVAPGRYPRWSRDGRELFYSGPKQMLMAMKFDGRGEEPDLFDAEPLFPLLGGPASVWYDTGRDGTFVVAQPLFDEPEQPLTLITNWNAR